MVSFIQI